LFSSNLIISLSVLDTETGVPPNAEGAEADGGITTTTGAGAGDAGGRILPDSCDEEGGFVGEPGFGGSEGWRGEFAEPDDGPFIGRGECSVVEETSIGDSLLVIGFGSLLSLVGGTNVAAFAAAAFAFACASRSAVFVRVFFLSSIRASSCLIFFTKSLTLPGLSKDI